MSSKQRATHARATAGLRFASMVPQEIRVEGVGTVRRIIGHAAVWDSETKLFDGYHEVVRRGAFAKTIRESDVLGLFNHDPNIPLGRLSAGDLVLDEDERGLRYEIEIDHEDSDARSVVRKIQTGKVRGSSFGFRAVKAPETVREDGSVLRELREVQLFDVSPVVYPQYAETDTQLRAWLGSQAAGSDPGLLVQILRQTGLTDGDIRATLAAGIEDVAASEPPQPGHSSHHAIDHMQRALELSQLAP
tara:strand:+ start:2724 stop:3464 length:741 start_codon:yes stop_codon:yes gene_type:complete